MVLVESRRTARRTKFFVAYKFQTRERGMGYVRAELIITVGNELENMRLTASGFSPRLKPSFQDRQLVQDSVPLIQLG